MIQEIAIKAPPAQAKSGELFIISENPKADFTDHLQEIALKIDNGWRFTKPTKWLEVTLDQDGSKYCWNGRNWQALDVNSNKSDVSNISKPQTTKIETKPPPKPKTETKNIVQNDLLINKENGEYLKIGHLEEKLVLKGLHTDTSIKIPHHTIVIAVNVRVIKKITGTNNFSVGIADDPPRYGNNLGSNLDTTNIGLSNQPLAYWNDTAIRISPSNGSFTDGKLHITIQYLKPHGPWNWD